MDLLSLESEHVEAELTLKGVYLLLGGSGHPYGRGVFLAAEGHCSREDCPEDALASKAHEGESSSPLENGLPNNSRCPSGPENADLFPAVPGPREAPTRGEGSPWDLSANRCSRAPAFSAAFGRDQQAGRDVAPAVSGRCS